MKIIARLPLTRWTAGELHVETENGIVVVGPVRCRGEADNTAAAGHGNAAEDPVLSYGDHPYGVYRVTHVTPIDMRTHQADTYGPFFLKLDPLAGEALKAKDAGRNGIGIHGGKLHADSRLRETFGCLRVDDTTIQILATMVAEDLRRGYPVLYECQQSWALG